MRASEAKAKGKERAGSMTLERDLRQSWVARSAFLDLVSCRLRNVGGDVAAGSSAGAFGGCF